MSRRWNSPTARWISPSIWWSRRSVPVSAAFYQDVNITVDNYEIGAVVQKAAAVSIVDSGAENGTADRLQAVLVDKAYGEGTSVATRSPSLSLYSWVSTTSPAGGTMTR